MDVIKLENRSKKNDRNKYVLLNEITLFCRPKNVTAIELRRL